MNFVLSAEQIVGPCAIRLREAAADAARMRAASSAATKSRIAWQRRAPPFQRVSQGALMIRARLFQPGANERSLMRMAI
jgi:hypothetical protein